MRIEEVGITILSPLPGLYEKKKGGFLFHGLRVGCAATSPVATICGPAGAKTVEKPQFFGKKSITALLSKAKTIERYWG